MFKHVVNRYFVIAKAPSEINLAFLRCSDFKSILKSFTLSIWRLEVYIGPTLFLNYTS